MKQIAPSKNRKRRKTVQAAVESFEPRRLMSSAPGSLDTTFNSIGVAAVPLEGSTLFAATVQADGKIVAVGDVIVGGVPEVLLGRFEPDGSADTSFGTNGTVETAIDDTGDVGFSLHLQADGKILVAASASQYLENRQDSYILRFSSNGSLDTSFATKGIYTSADRVSGFALQGDGKILVVGTTSDATSGNVAKGFIVRLSTTGALDQTFGTNGETMLSLGNATADSVEFRDVAITASGTIIASGSEGVATYSGDTTGDYLIARFSNSGKLDTTFGPSKKGYVTTDVSGSDLEVNQVLLPNGDILVDGISNRFLETVEVSMIEYHSDGSLDTNFGMGGKTLLGIYTHNEPTDAGGSVALGVESNGRIVGSVFLGTSTSPVGSRLFQLNANGAFDTSFGTNGVVDTDDIGYFNSMALQADGKIVQVGSTTALSTAYAVAARWIDSSTTQASISGNIFDDSDGNGVKESGENNIADATVYIDAAGTGSYVSTDPATVTDPNGDFNFGNLPAGTYRVRVVSPPGYRMTAPQAGYEDVTISTGQQLSGIIFGLTTLPLTTSIVVTPAANQNVTTDVAKVFSLGNFTQTNATGPYTVTVKWGDGSRDTQFTTLAAGLIAPQSHAYSASGTETVSLTVSDSAGHISNIATFVVAVAAVVPTTGTITGSTDTDDCGTGLMTYGTPLPGVAVDIYADTKKDSVLDSGDKLVAKLISDSHGDFSENNLSAGRYYVKEVVPAGYLRTVPNLASYYDVDLSAGETSSTNTFGNFKKVINKGVTNVTYQIGSHTFSSLTGHTAAGETVNVTFTVTNPSGEKLSLVSYTAPDAKFHAVDAFQQRVFAQTSAFYAAGTYTISMKLPPSGHYQLDFVEGCVITQFGPAGSNLFYASQGRLISADNA